MVKQAWKLFRHTYQGTTEHTNTHATHIHTLKTGTFPKNSENLSESMVADVTINFRSFLLATTLKGDTQLNNETPKAQTLPKQNYGDAQIHVYIQHINWH